MPPHAFRKSPAPSGRLSVGGEGEWSVTIMSSAPLASPAHSASRGADARIGWIPITVSIGVAVFPRHGLTAIDLLDAADQALYAAKDAGRDTFAVAPLTAATGRRDPSTGGELTPTSQAPVTSGG